MTTVKILGPARNLRRVREQVATVEQVLGLFRSHGTAHAFSVTFKLTETKRRIRVLMTREALEELEDRLTTAAVFATDRKLPEKEPPPQTRPRRKRAKPQRQPPLFEEDGG